MMDFDLTANGQQERKPRERPPSFNTNEAVLRASELRLQRLLETDAVGILFFDAATGILLDANDVFLRLSGYTREQVHSRQLTWRTLTPSEWIDVSEEQMKRFAITGRIGPYEKEYFCADASRRWMLFTGRDLGDGTIAEYCLDLTERKRAEAALSRYAAIVESSEDAIASGTLDGMIVTWNAGAQQMYGYTEAEAVGKPITILVPPELRDEENKILATLKDGGRIERFETVRVAKTGKRINVSLSISPIKDSSGAIVGVAGIARDISDRKRHEEKLREYERAVEHAEEMIAVVDLDYRYLIANRQFLRLRNMTQEQVVGRFVYEVVTEGVFEAEVKPRLDECFQGKVVRYEMKYTYPELGERDLLVSYFPIEGAHGIDRAACILQDITDRKRAEESLAGMSRKLIDSQEQERSRIGRELHDDINQRLAMLALELEQLQDDPSDIQNRLQDFRKQVTEISKDVQALSHDLHSSKLEYLGVVAGIKSWCKEFGERQTMEIDFKSNVSSALPLEVGICLFRVLQEALHNASKHSGVKRIEVRLSEHLNEVHLLVRDSGKGFDVEAVTRSHGLGLTSMQERVRLLNGSIEVQSRPMGGTTIQVRIPLASGQNAKLAAG